MLGKVDSLEKGKQPGSLLTLPGSKGRGESLASAYIFFFHLIDIRNMISSSPRFSVSLLACLPKTSPFPLFYLTLQLSALLVEEA